MISHHAVALLIATLLGGYFAEPEFRLGVSGNAGDEGFVIQSVDSASPLRTLRDTSGNITMAEPGDRILMLGEQSFSPDKLRSMSKSLVGTNGLVEMVLFDAKANTKVQVSAVLRRTDGDAEFIQGFRKIVSDEYAGVNLPEVRLKLHFLRTR